VIAVFLLLLQFILPMAHAGECEGPSNCGLTETIIPDFTLSDLNTRSDSYSRTLSRDDFLGEVLLIYWAQAT